MCPMTRENVFSPDSLSCYAGGVYMAISKTQLSGFVASQDAVYKAVQTTMGVGRAMSVKNSPIVKQAIVNLCLEGSGSGCKKN
jgi:hypothetical protein